MNVALILVILLALLLTGTPISIALGMTVLTFLALFSSFSIETVDIVSQRLFTGLESFAIMAVPFLSATGIYNPPVMKHGQCIAEPGSFDALYCPAPKTAYHSQKRKRQASR